MIWAIKENQRIKAQPKSKGYCPCCNEELIPKCGFIKIWHWAHKSINDCDDWYEPESEWHINWKKEYPKEQQEVIIEKSKITVDEETSFFEIPFEYYEKEKKRGHIKKHIADIKTQLRIIELQNSSISPEEIIEREKFYGKMVWLLNGKTLGKGMKMKEKNGIIKFRWYHPPQSWWYAQKPIYIDFSDIQQEEGKWIGENDYMGYEGYWKNIADEMDREIFLIKKLYNNTPCGGWGILITKEEFLNGR